MTPEQTRRMMELADRLSPGILKFADAIEQMTRRMIEVACVVHLRGRETQQVYDFLVENPALTMDPTWDDMNRLGPERADEVLSRHVLRIRDIVEQWFRDNPKPEELYS